MFAALKSGAAIPSFSKPAPSTATPTSTPQQANGHSNAFSNGGPPRSGGGGDCKVKVYNIPEGRICIYVFTCVEVLLHIFFFIGNSIFHLSLGLVTKFWKTSLKVA